MSNFIPVSVDNLRFGSHIVELQGHNVLVLSGEIDAYTAPQLKQSIASILDGHEEHLIVDMLKVRYMESIGISILIFAVKRLSPNGGTVNLVGCQPHIDRLLSITKMSTIFTLYENMYDAMEALSA